MNEQLKKKVDQAIRLLQTSCKDKEVELCYSGGKDSDVILELAKMAGNSIVVNVLYHIFRKMFVHNVPPQRTQMTLF